MASTSRSDNIMASLVAAGYTTGTIDDRERKRLLTALALSEPQRLSLQDLYKLAGEKPRLW